LEKGLEHAARGMLADGMSFRKIAKITGLPVDKIKGLVQH